MQLAQITKLAGPDKGVKRLGRGRGSGHGKTSTRGTKGMGARAGSGCRLLREGGQMPLFRRIPKRGFSNARFETVYQVVNVAVLEASFEAGSLVTKNVLADAGLIGTHRGLVKILGDGELTKKLTVEADKFSKSARDKITAAGGTTKELIRPAAADAAQG
ncbi:MAG: 50S ribosomal protein L15 [Phycisphaerae bacterium]|nr:50S ribosomal protein L15 [Phycisphaerae bacterium]